jgi:hypothetical protein
MIVRAIVDRLALGGNIIESGSDCYHLGSTNNTAAPEH